ncbi:MAG: thioredoxin [Candidatus Omnitrophota bacterium]
MGENLVGMVNDDNFGREVLEAKIPVLVDFWARWCGPCRMMAPVVAEIAKEYEGKLKVCKIDVEESSQVSARYEVMNVPTFIIFKNGEMRDKIVGAVPKNDLVSKIDGSIAI